MYHSNRNVPLSLLLIFLTFLFSCSGRGRDDAIRKPSFTPSRTIEDEWMGAYYEGKKIGYVHSTAEEGLLDGQPARRISSRARVELSIEGEKSHTELKQTAYLDGSGLLAGFEYDQNIMGHRMLVRGLRSGDDLKVIVNAGGDSRKRVFPFSDDLYTPGLLKYAIVERGLELGKKAEYNVFLEPLLAVEPLTMEVISRDNGYVDGRKVAIYNIEESFKGIRGTLRITGEGRTIEETSPNGFKLLSESAEEAKGGVQALSITDLLLASLIKVEKAVENPRSLEELTLKLIDVPADFPVIEDSHQRIIGTKESEKGLEYTFRISVKAIPEESPLIPVKGRAFDLYLLADHVVNSDNKEIIKRAARIVGGERSARKAAGKIHDWVYKNIDKKLIDTVSAVDTLRTREGECQAHANLYAALARSVGIPAKIISGLVYSSEFSGFMYHSWNEVYVGEWISVDPTLGGFPADATHLKLAEGGLEKQLKIMALVGRIRAEVLQ